MIALGQLFQAVDRVARGISQLWTIDFVADPVQSGISGYESTHDVSLFDHSIGEEIPPGALAHHCDRRIFPDAVRCTDCLGRVAG